MPIYGYCFDSGMNIVFSAKAANFKRKVQEDKPKKEKNKNIGSTTEKEIMKDLRRIIGKANGIN